VIVMVTFGAVAEVVVKQEALEVITTDIKSLLLSELDVYEEELLPTLMPFNFHWYAGVVPPFIGAAVNVTELPIQAVDEGEALTVTEGVKAVET
jgi:hypothetical protein